MINLANNYIEVIFINSEFYSNTYLISIFVEKYLKYNRNTHKLII